MSIGKKFIDLKAISDDEISRQQINIIDLWMIRDESNKVFGPFDTKTLKYFVEDHEEEFQNIMVNNLATETWKVLFSVTQFQRRKPRLVPAQSIVSTEEFYLLTDGQKDGPYNLKELKVKIKDENIALNNQVSVDNGSTWIKIFEHYEFDRRLHNENKSLPFSPEQSVFDNQNQETETDLNNKKKVIDEEDALIGLAFIGHGNDSGQTYNTAKPIHPIPHGPNSTKSVKEHIHHGYEDEEIEVKSGFKGFMQKMNWKHYSAAFVTVIMIFTAFNSMDSTFSNKSDKLNNKKKIAVKSNRKSINNSQRNTAKRVPASITPTKKIHAKKYRPIKRKAKRAPARRRAKRIYKKPNERVRYEDYDQLDIDDPRVREELSRELASEVDRNDARDPRDREIDDDISAKDILDMHDNEDNYQEIRDFE